MNSLVCQRHFVQWLTTGLFFGLGVVVLFGCQPSRSNKPEPPAGKSPAASSDPTASPSPDAAAPQKDLPAVDSPVGDMPNPSAEKQPSAPPANEAPPKASPADPPADPKTSGLKSPPIVLAAFKKEKSDESGAAVAGDVDVTLTAPAKWLPKPTENPQSIAASEAGMKPYTEKIPSTEAKFDMVPIPGGTFKMGSPAGESNRKADEGPQVDVRVDPFWMGKCEVTWEQYELWCLGIDQQRRKARKAAPSDWDKAADALAIPTKPYADMSFGMGKEGYPAVCMTQFAAKLYCKWLSAKTGRYYRLPTEAEWEYACRAGGSDAYSFGNDAEKLGDYAWFDGNSNEKYHKVGLKKPNRWGLYDMHGNVAEWCLDQYIPDRYQQLAGKLSENPLTPVTSAYPTVVRGGAWTDEAPLCRCSARRGSTKDWKAQDPQVPQSIWYHTDANFVGFRLVRPLRRPTPEESARYDLTEFEKEEYQDYKDSGK